MKKIVLAAAIFASFASHVSAQEAAPVHDISFNAAVTSDYRFRGISQSRLDPALQLGADYVHTPSGVYVGTWASSIKWLTDSGDDASMETNLYAGISGDTPVAGLGYDVGVLRYYYPGTTVGTNTTEVYGQLSYGPAYVKYSHAVTDLFGVVDSKNSGYLDIGADIEMPYGLTLNLHAGFQKVKNYSDSDYSDWLVGVSKDFSVGTVSLAYVDTDLDAAPSGPKGEDVNKGGVVLTFSKSF